MRAINFSHLTGPELEAIFTTFCALDGALDLLQRHGVIDEAEDYDLADIEDALDGELSRRAQEDAEFVLERGIAAGLFERILLPSGLVAYAPAPSGRIGT